MLARLLGHVNLIVIALAVALLPGVALLVGSAGWFHARGQDLVARQLADTFQREVAVGPVSGDLLRGVQFGGLAVARGRRLRDGAVFTAKRTTLRYNLKSILRAPLAAPAAVAEIHLYSPQLLLTQDATGRLNLADILPPSREVPPERQFRGKIIVHDGLLVFESRARYVKQGLLQAQAARIEGTVDMARAPEVSADLSGEIASGQATRFAARVATQPKAGLFALQGSVDDLDLRWTQATFAPQFALQAESGRASVRGHVFVVPAPQGRHVDFGVRGDLRETQCRLAGFGPDPVRLSGPVWVGNDGVRLDQVQATWGGATVDVSGTLSGFRDPVLDVALATEDFPAQRLSSLLPPAARRQYGLNRLGRLALDATVVGPASDPDVRLTGSLTGGARVTAPHYGTVGVQRVVVQAETVGLRRPVVKAAFKLSRLSTPAFSFPGGEGKMPKWPRQVRLAPLETMDLQGEWAGAEPTGTVTFSAPEAYLDTLHLQDVQAKVRVAPDVVRVERLSARALGGKLQARGLAWREGKQIQGTATGRVEGAALERLSELPLTDVPDIKGSADVTFQVRRDGQTTAGKADVQIADLAWQNAFLSYAEGQVGVTDRPELTARARLNLWGGTYDEISGLDGQVSLGLTGKQLQVVGAYLGGEAGMLWARGSVDLDQRLTDLEVRLAELDVKAAGLAAEQSGLGGTAYFSGRVRGPLKSPGAQGRLLVFNPRYGGYELSALTADMAYDGQDLEVDRAYANLGKAVVSTSGAVQDIRGPPEQAKLRGEAQIEGMDLERLTRFLRTAWPVAGVAEVTATLSGTLHDPCAEGVLTVSHGRYDEYLADSAVLPFSAGREMISVTNGRASAYGTDLKLNGQVTLGQPAVVDAHLSADGLRLEGLAPLWDLGLPISGTAGIEDAWIKGPTTDLQGGGRLVASQLTVGREEVRDLVAEVALKGGEFTLKRASAQAARGQMTASGAYDYASEDQTLGGQLTFKDVDVPLALSLAIPFAQAGPPGAKAPAKRRAQALQRWALRLGGLVDGSVTLAGPRQHPELRLVLDTRKNTLDGRQLPDVKGQAQLNGRRWTGVDIALRQDPALITISGNLDLDGAVEAMVDGSGISLGQLRPWVDLKVPVAGRLGFSVMASGKSRRPDLIASVDVQEPSLAGVRFDVLSVPVANLTEGALDVDSLILKRGRQEILVSGHVPFSWEVPRAATATAPARVAPGLRPQGGLKVEAKIAQTELAFFLPLLDEFLRGQAQSHRQKTPTFAWSSLDAKGTVDSTVTLTGTPAAPELRGSLKVAQGVILPPHWKTPLSPISLDAVVTGRTGENRLELSDLTVGYDDVRANFAGQIKLAQLLGARFDENTYDLTLQVKAGDQGLPGSTRLKDLTGKLALQTVAPGRHRLTTGPLQGKLGGGDIKLSGGAEFTDLSLARLERNNYDIHLTVNGARLRYTGLADVLFNGGLDITTPAEGPAVIKGRFRANDGIFVVGPMPKNNLRTLHGASSRFPKPRLDLVVALGDRVVARGAGITMPLETTPELVSLTGTPQEPTLTGSVSALRGTTSLPAGRLTVDDFRVHYSVAPVRGIRRDPQPLEVGGTVQGHASTTLDRLRSTREGSGPVRITLELSGRLPDALRVSASSDPPLSEPEIYALLGGLPSSSLLGTGLDEADLTRIVSERFLATVATAFRMRVFAPFEDELKRMLGLSELGITFAFDQPVAVKVGKYLLRNFLVTYQRSLTESPEAYDLSVSYQLPSGLRVSYNQDDRGRNQVELGYAFDF